MKRFLQLAAVGLALAWAVFGLAHYYQNWPAKTGFLVALLAHISAVVQVTLVLTAFLLVGRSVLRLARAHEATVAQPDFALAVGAMTYVGLGFGLGVLGLFYDWLLVLSLVLGVVISLRDGIELASASAKSLQAQPPSVRSLASAVVVVLVALLTVQSLGPPLGPDEFVHHLNGASHRLEAHSLAMTLETRNIGGMQSAIMLYSYCLSGPDGELAAKLFNVCLLVGLLWSLKELVRRHLPQTNAAMAALLLVSQPVVESVVVRPYSDLLATWLVLVSVRAALDWVDTRAASSLRLSAFVMGAALATKMTLVFALVGLIAAVTIDSLRAKEGRAVFRRAVSVGGVAMLVASPWFAWNWWYFGTPLFPFFQQLFSPGQAPPIADTFFTEVNPTLVLAKDPLSFFMLPYTLTVGHDPPMNIWGNLVLPGFALLLPMSVVSAASSRKAAVLLVVAFTFFCLWSRAMNLVRYLLPVLPLVALLVVNGVRVLAQKLPAQNRLIEAGVLVLAITVPALGQTWELLADSQTPKAMAYASGDIDKAAFYESTYFDAMYKMSVYCNENLDPKTTRIRLFGQAQNYYLEVPNIQDALALSDLYELGRSSDWQMATMWQALRSQGVTHVLFDLGTYESSFGGPKSVFGRSAAVREKAQRGVDFFEAFAHTNLVLEHRNGSIRLYRLRDEAHSGLDGGP